MMKYMDMKNHGKLASYHRKRNSQFTMLSKINENIRIIELGEVKTSKRNLSDYICYRIGIISHVSSC